MASLGPSAFSESSESALLNPAVGDFRVPANSISLAVGLDVSWPILTRLLRCFPTKPHCVPDTYSSKTHCVKAAYGSKTNCAKASYGNMSDCVELASCDFGLPPMLVPLAMLVPG